MPKRSKPDLPVTADLSDHVWQRATRLAAEVTREGDYGAHAATYAVFDTAPGMHGRYKVIVKDAGNGAWCGRHLFVQCPAVAKGRKVACAHIAAAALAEYLERYPVAS